VEQGVEEGKTELGMDHYEGRKYSGWHHHMLTTMRAHFFLWHLKSRLGKKSACPDRGPDPESAGGHLAPAPVDD
jgi:SRSO17 transposase